MKRSIFYFLLLSILMGGTPLHAATQTLTTYYPAPSGNYRKLQTSSMQLTASTLSSIQAQYHCSFDPAAGLSPCPAGLMYYDTDSQTVFVSAGTHWSSINATCVPVTACSATLNCGNDSCGISCGSCIGGKTCSSPTTNIPGSCI